MGGDAQRALEHAQAALTFEPDNAEALVAARDAAQALGDHARAESYGRLLRAPGDGDGQQRWPVGGPGPEDNRWVESELDAEELAIPEGFTELDPEGLIETDRPQ